MKRLFKFLAIMIISLFIGGVSGYFIAGYGADLKTFFNNLNDIINSNAIYASLVFFVLDIALSVAFFISGKKSINKQLSADVDIIDDRSISVSMVITGLSYMLVLVFAEIGIANILRLEKNSIFLLATGLILIIGAIIFTTVMNVKQVNFVKSYSPEKKGHALDLNFSKTWEDSMDERELFELYKAGYHAYKAVINVLAILPVVVFLISSVTNLNFVPFFVILIIYITANIFFVKSSLKK